MIYKTRSITLKDGRGAILRAPRESDAEEMLEYLRTASGETEFLASYPEELKFTAEDTRCAVIITAALLVICATRFFVPGLA